MNGWVSQPWGCAVKAYSHSLGHVNSFINQVLHFWGDLSLENACVTRHLDKPNLTLGSVDLYRMLVCTQGWIGIGQLDSHLSALV